MPEEAAPQPEEAPQAAPEPAPEAPTQQGGERPITRYARNVQQFADNAENTAAEKAQGFKGWIRGILGFEREAPSEVGLIKTPIVAAGHVIDGPGLGTVRAGVEIAEPSVDTLRAGWRCSIGKILHPFKTILHPIQTIKDFIRLGTSLTMVAKNTLVAPIHIADDTVERSINNTVEQVNFKISKIPLIGKLISKPTNWITGMCKKISNSIRQGIDWVLSPIDKLHEAVAPA